MSTDQKLGSDTAILLLKELSMTTWELIRTGEKDYSDLRGPMGVNTSALSSLPPEDLKKLTDLENPENMMNALDSHRFSIDDLKTAVSDLLKESRDLDGASVIAPKIEALLDQLNELGSKDPIDHQQLFENTLTSLAEANSLFATTDGIMEDFLTDKQGQAAALDQMHEDEFLASAQVVTLVLGKMAVENGVDIQVGMETAEMTAKANLGIVDPVFGKIAEMVESRITELHESLDVELSTPEQMQAHSALLEKLHDIQAGGNPDGFNEKLHEYKQTFDQSLEIGGEYATFGGAMHFMEMHMDSILKQNGHLSRDVFGADPGSSAVAQNTNQMISNPDANFDGPTL